LPYHYFIIIFDYMETIIKIKDSAEGKKLIAHLQSLSYVKVLGNSTDLIDVKELKSKVKRAEKSKPLSMEEAISRSAAWKSKYK
jgi:hypothetical protein